MPPTSKDQNIITAALDDTGRNLLSFLEKNEAPKSRL